MLIDDNKIQEIQSLNSLIEKFSEGATNQEIRDINLVLDKLFSLIKDRASKIVLYDSFNREI